MHPTCPVQEALVGTSFAFQKNLRLHDTQVVRLMITCDLNENTYAEKILGQSAQSTVELLCLAVPQQAMEVVRQKFESCSHAAPQVEVNARCRTSLSRAAKATCTLKEKCQQVTLTEAGSALLALDPICIHLTIWKSRCVPLYSLQVFGCTTALASSQQIIDAMCMLK